MPSRINESNQMFDINDNFNSMLLPENALLVSFDIANMFHNIHNKSAVKFILLKRSTTTPPVERVLKVLELCLT